MKNTSKLVHISLVNWKRWKDTVECIDSLLKQDYKDIRIYIIDNNSGDDSLQKFIDFFEGRLAADLPSDKSILDTLGNNNLVKSYLIIEEADWNEELFKSLNTTFVIIKNTKNYGFGFAHNQVMRFVANQKDCYSWILNNDTIVPKDAISHLVNDLETHPKSFATPLLAYYDEPSLLQCDGTATLNPFLGFAKMNEKLSQLAKVISSNNFVNSPNTFISGTALFVPSGFIKEVGGFDEIFFMYSEDIDLSIRAKKMNWKPIVSSNSYIFHKESKSTSGRKYLFYEMYTRGNFILLQKHFSLLHILTAIPSSILHTITMGGFSIKNIWFTIRGITSAFTVWKSRK